MAIRVTTNQITANFQSDVLSVYEKMSRTQRQLSTGERITAPSDDPFGTAQVMSFDAQLSDVRQFQRNVTDAVDMIDTQDAALGTMGDALLRIRELLTQAANGTTDSQALAAIANEVQQLKETVRDSANAQHGSTFVFGGTATSSAPFPAPLNAYVGTTNVMTRRVSVGTAVQVNIDGQSVLGPNGANTLDLIDTIVADLNGTNRLAFPIHMTSINAEIDRILNARTQLGATSARLETTQSQLEAVEERLMSARTEVADVDFAEAYAKFQSQQTMYQAALSAGSRMMQTTILDFI
jgi:flagellar hook-associated protein 3 FlgL